MKLSSKIKPKPAYKRWGLFNMGNLWSIHRTAALCRAEAVSAYGEPWENARSCFEVRRVTVKPGADDGK